MFYFSFSNGKRSYENSVIDFLSKLKYNLYDDIESILFKK